MSRIVAALKSPGLWFLALLLIANGIAWAGALGSGEVRFIKACLEPDLAALRERLGEGGHSGEPFTVVVTNQEAEETIAWYLERHPRVPFASPRVEIHQDTIEAWGEANVAGLRVGLHGRARIVLWEGMPVVTVEDLGMAGLSVPGFVRRRIQQEIDAQFSLDPATFPVLISRFELREGQAIVEGTIR
ncbi:MAG: hypothetical protein B6I34_10625 [Anaerolineaceae bacterium 4572_32.1]|nr:MAG: hypothetical protein B6I34_10625 [Anaerolineaceae bacterium 4572_32.1]